MKASVRSELLKLLKKTQSEGMKTSQQVELANKAGLYDPRAPGGWRTTTLNSFKAYWGIRSRNMRKSPSAEVPKRAKALRLGPDKEDQLALIELIAQQKTMPREQRLKAIRILSGAEI